jgi:hypothetical protein
MSANSQLYKDLYTQARWMTAEMSEHSHDKTDGYEEKWRRLHLPSDDAQSVMGFMGSYWKRFQRNAYNKEFPIAENPDFAPSALQQLGKVPNGLTDKVGLILWKVNPAEDEYIDEAVALVLEKAIGTVGVTASINYSEQLQIPNFPETLMGQGVEQLHQTVSSEQPDLGIAVNVALNTAVHGMFTWQAYLDELRAVNIDSAMPKPGEPSGNILPWTEG